MSRAATVVRLPAADHLAPLLDDLAIAYAENPDEVGRLLALHAGRVLALDTAVVRDVSDVVRAIAAAEADGSRAALLDLAPSNAATATVTTIRTSKGRR